MYNQYLCDQITEIYFYMLCISMTYTDFRRTVFLRTYFSAFFLCFSETSGSVFCKSPCQNQSPFWFEFGYHTPLPSSTQDRVELYNESLEGELYLL